MKNNSTSLPPRAEPQAIWRLKSSKRLATANQCKPLHPPFFPHPSHILSSSDVWAIGVITYFLLCGYPPFDRESNLEEMQAILIADYSFTPTEFWRGVSQNAREFIKRCLTVDPVQRMTSHQALQHPWIKGADPLSPQTPESATAKQEDLLPVIKKNFNARRTLHKAIDTVRAINKLREGGGLMMGMMDGAMSLDPKPKPEMVNGSRVTGGDDGAGTPMDGIEGMARGSEAPSPPLPLPQAEDKGGSTPRPAGNGQNDPDAMEIDSRSNARGQTQEQIRLQEKRVRDAVTGLWSRR
jgi:calcium/calmodulin-dependent protein kinase I